MVRVLLVLQALVIVLVVLLHSPEAHAQATRTWVSSVGDDVNTCTRTAPCRTFAGALARVAAGGEIDVLDPGGYGAVMITKSVTIDGTGTLGAINTSGTNGIVINDSLGATPGTAVVTLRGLSISGSGTTLGVRGIHVVSAGKVTVEDSVVSNHSIAGIDVAPTTGAPSLLLRNVVVRNNTGAGILLSGPATIPLKASIIGCTVIANGGVGLHAKQHTRVSVSRSEFSQNGGVGVVAEAVSGIAFVLLKSSTMAFNATQGVRAGLPGSGGSSVVKIADCEISGNTGGGVLVSTGGSVGTFNNNRILGNGGDGCPGCTGEGPGA